MTREEQKAYNAENYPASVLSWMNEVTDRAFNELESRTCESCKYTIKRGFVDKVCDNESGIAYDVVVKTTDGCNKWDTVWLRR